MTEAAFPILGSAFVVLVVLPASALVAKFGLAMLERHDSGPFHAVNLRYLLLAGSSLLPIAWFFSAALHQAESGKSVLACLLDHDATALCLEPGFFAAVLGSVVLFTGFRALRRFHGPRVSGAAGELEQRLQNILQCYPMLSGLRERLLVTHAPDFALATTGIFKPRVYVGTGFAANLSDAMLASALGHEQEHVRAFDPLRYVILHLALQLNPFGRALLEPHAARWRAAREAHCDRQAVIDGAAPLSLADAIVRAARPAVSQVALGARDTAVLKFRVGMLLAFAEKSPARCCDRGLAAFPAAIVLLIAVLFLPHQTGTAALDALHTGAEHALTYFAR